jgi:hypothetical protein
MAVRYSHQIGRHMNSALDKLEKQNQAEQEVFWQDYRGIIQKKEKGLQEKSCNPLFYGAHGANRTRDTWIRNPVLYPLSYAGRMVFSGRRA